MKKKTLIALVILAMTLAACSPAASTRSLNAVAEEKGYESMPMEAPAAAAPAMEMDSGFTANSYSGDTVQAQAVERIVIKNASLSIVVVDPAVAMDTIGKMAESMGGFIVSSNLYKSYTSQGVEVPAGDITIRVPADGLTSALDRVKGLVEDPKTDIRNENVSGQDVTQEYTDLQSRLRNLEEAEAQLREIMASATKTDDVLQIFNELTRVRQDIEVLQGQINYYNEASRLSSISVSIISKASVEPLTVAGWQPVGVARDALQALVDAFQFIVNALIWIVLFILPVLLLILLPIYLVFLAIRALVRRRKARKVAAAPQEEPKQPVE
ncbi:hypothetical protein ADN00_18610 [Ornatilinea apprima]|uniref:DUF4349 domain-containing protein n=1 Tax=Ornatilinea apprima TaxID=1134406 RepID=A0A0P6WK57_9CHLR|nr:DUF4349 domain-containing protein [Ornatilinea apprima]KPL70061.1 hypothetical protein ADN00_18610 [Ornatilinea apprima]